MTKEALKLALEALEDLGMKHYESTGEVLYKDTFTAIKELLMSVPDRAQPEQEPVAWMHPDGRIWTFGRGFDKSTFTVPLYTTPPQRTWVGLTPEEIDEIIEDAIDSMDALLQTMDKLKEKNT